MWKTCVHFSFSFIFFNWTIIALQVLLLSAIQQCESVINICVCVCVCVCISSLLSLPSPQPIPLVFTELWAGLPVLYSSYLFFKFLFILYIFGCAGSSLLHGLFCSCGESYSLAAVRGLLTVVFLPLWSMGSRVCKLKQLQHVYSVVMAPRL